MARHRLSDRDFRKLLEFRTRLRQFEQWSRQQAAVRGLTHSQHQLLLAIRGHPDDRGPTMGEVAGYLVVRHHTAVELVDRTQELGLVERDQDSADHRVVRLRLTAEGKSRLRALTALHLEELRQLAPTLEALVTDPSRNPG